MYNMTKIDRKIFVTFQKEGIHKYPEALTNPDLQEVSFLAYPHRHMFYFKVTISVDHDNRAIEFIIFKRWLESLYSDKTLDLDFKSCEMIAQDLYVKINEKYPNHTVIIEVSEDFENGAILTFEPVSKG